MAMDMMGILLYQGCDAAPDDRTEGLSGWTCGRWLDRYLLIIAKGVIPSIASGPARRDREGAERDHPYGPPAFRYASGAGGGAEFDGDPRGCRLAHRWIPP